MNRKGLYLWGGPAIVDLLKVKYHRPKIDLSAHYWAYEYSYWQKAKEILGITDLWLCYSWGFKDETEKRHKKYISQKLDQLKDLNITTYGYVQGFNVVTADFKDRPIFCRDHRGKLLPYSKDRSLICPNNPLARQLMLSRVEQACQSNFDAVYMDNMLFGLPPFFVSQSLTSFFGCSCQHCQTKFKQMYGYTLPIGSKKGKQVIMDYLDFRTESLNQAVAEFARSAHNHRKHFGVNLYDLFDHTPELYFGYSFKKIAPWLDYYLIENHRLINNYQIDNSHLKDLIQTTSKPVFVLSYQKGIGCDTGYGQKQLDLIYSESSQLGYCPCLKGSEFVTNRTWHPLRLDRLAKPRTDMEIKYPAKIQAKKLKNSSQLLNPLISGLSLKYPAVMRYIYNNPKANYLLHHSGLYTYALKSYKNYYF